MKIQTRDGTVTESNPKPIEERVAHGAIAGLLSRTVREVEDEDGNPRQVFGIHPKHIRAHVHKLLRPDHLTDEDGQEHYWTATITLTEDATDAERALLVDLGIEERTEPDIDWSGANALRKERAARVAQMISQVAHKESPC